MKVHKTFFMVGLVGLLLLSSCSSAAQLESSNPTDAEPTHYPTVAVVQPASGKSVITGSLVQKGTDGNPDIPYEGLRVYLGILLIADDGKSTLARVDPMNAPQAITDVNGRFVFQDIEPTNYILVLQVPPNNLMKLNDPVTGKDMLIEAKSGEITDIGPQNHYLPWFLETPGPS